MCSWHIFGYIIVLTPFEDCQFHKSTLWCNLPKLMSRNAQWTFSDVMSHPCSMKWTIIANINRVSNLDSEKTVCSSFIGCEESLPLRPCTYGLRLLTVWLSSLCQWRRWPFAIKFAVWVMFTPALVWLYRTHPSWHMVIYSFQANLICKEFQWTPFSSHSNI